MLIGSVGLGLLVYGKKAANLPCLAAGIAMSVFPCFVHSVLVMWALAGACVAGLVLAKRCGT
jgi:hypothetical protein